MIAPTPFRDFLRQYFLDADVLMSAWHDHYPPDLHPGFWEFLEHCCLEGRIRSVDRVLSEILSPDDLVAWANRQSESMFVFSGDESVVIEYKKMQDWVQNNDQFLPTARDDFARGADGWLVAYAKVHNGIVVTNEIPDPNVRRRVPIPNLCHKFHVSRINTLDMLRELGAKFEFRRTT